MSKALGLTCSESTFFPQSIEAQQHGHLLEDHDALTPSTIYLLRPCDRLEVGKYVPDPTDGKDPSNPKYDGSRPLTSTSGARATLASANGARATLASASGVRVSLSSASGTRDNDAGEIGDAVGDDGEAEGDDDDTTTAISASGDLVEYTMVKPAALCGRSSPLAGSLYFPVHYPNPSVKDRQDPRGLPQHINDTLHPKDRDAMSLDVIGVKAVNLNKVMLFKIGPGAVAFRVVINALEAAGMKYTPSNKLFNILWAKRATPAILSTLHAYQKINHFPATWGIGRKDSLAMNVGRMRRQYGASAINIVPVSFILPRDKDELADDVAQATEQSGAVPTYIVKPSASSCGRGIKLYRGMPRGERRLSVNGTSVIHSWCNRESLTFACTVLSPASTP
jgi:tubulin polyglutamylase TTLL4